MICASFRDTAECYRYDRPGIRSEKICLQQQQAVRYLPGLEWRQRRQIKLRVICVGTVRILRSRLERSQLRHAVSGRNDHRLLELDAQGRLISQEAYYPFGGTAHWACRSQILAGDKTLRYSGKERDISGLLFYGYRYYLPWLQRWLNPDPAGSLDGLNLLRMCRNNPVSCGDSDGRMPRKNPFLTPVKPEPLIMDQPFDETPMESESAQTSLSSLPLVPLFAEVELGEDEDSTSNIYNTFVSRPDKTPPLLNQIEIPTFSVQVDVESDQPLNSVHNPDETRPDEQSATGNSKAAQKQPQSGAPKKFACDIDGCEKSYLSLSGLTYHKQTHNLNRSYQCDKCGKYFMVRQVMQRHIKRIHPTVEERTCVICKQIFQTYRKMKDHLKVHDNENPVYTCQVPRCYAVYKLQAKFKTHMANSHPGTTYIHPQGK